MEGKKLDYFKRKICVYLKEEKKRLIESVDDSAVETWVFKDSNHPLFEMASQLAEGDDLGWDSMSIKYVFLNRFCQDFQVHMSQRSTVLAENSRTSDRKEANLSIRERDGVREASVSSNRPPSLTVNGSFGTNSGPMSPQSKLREGAESVLSAVKAAAGKLKGGLSMSDDDFRDARTTVTLDEDTFPASAPAWDQPGDYADCFTCHSQKHQHHCRLCGHMHCSRCTTKFDLPERFELKRKKGASRVCTSCEKQYLDKLGRWTAQMRSQPKMEVRSPLKCDHRSVPEWVSREGCSHCFHCQAPGQDLHHCRLCGQLFCERCTDKCDVPTNFEKQGKKNPVPVCYGCQAECRTRNHETFFPPNIREINEGTQMEIYVPEWEMPSLYSECARCRKTNGKGHNCRLCGTLYCGNCTSKTKVPDAFEKKNKTGESRVCDRCRYLCQSQSRAVLVPREVGEPDPDAPADGSDGAKDGSEATAVSAAKDELTADDVKGVLSLPSSNAMLFQKLQSSACAGCGQNFGLFVRRHKCFHCPVYWCHRCIKPHHIALEAQRPKKMIARIRNYSVKLFEGKRGKTKGPLDKIVVEEEGDGDDGNEDDDNGQGRDANFDPPSTMVQTKQGQQAMMKRQSSVKMAIVVEELVEGPKTWFEVAGRLGEGSYGAVYRALDKRDGSEVAVKILEREDEASSAPGSALMREIDFLKSCDSPFLVGYRGTYKVDEHTWIVMEYCSGGSLCDVIEITESTLTEPEIACAMRDTLQALFALHSSNKLHRDIKAGNILTTPDGVCKLSDFGVSCVLDSAESRRRTTIGSPYWMAPEVIMGKPYDGKADIWSLGITAIELAKGVPPNMEVHPMRVLFKIPLLPSPTLPDPDSWSVEFRDFLRWCLHKDPDQRASAADLLDHPFITDAPPSSVLGAKVKAAMADIEAFRAREMAETKQAVEQGSKDDQNLGLNTSVFSAGTLLHVSEDNGEEEEEEEDDSGIEASVVHTGGYESSVMRSSHTYVPDYIGEIRF